MHARGEFFFFFFPFLASQELTRELAIYGQGINIGIIDSGVDYTHPSLGGCFGTNCPIAGGFDFVGDGYNGQSTSGALFGWPRSSPALGRNTPVPDDDPKELVETL
jgi:subtilisin family serine protease